MITALQSLTRPAFALLIPRHLRRAAANAARFYGGPPFGREPCKRPSVRDEYRDLDGMDEAARLRAAIVRERKGNVVRSTVAKLRRGI
jgi:hypothetical protein